LIRNDQTSKLREIPVIINFNDRDLIYEAYQESCVSARLA